MKVKVIGCGNAFSKRSFNQCLLLSEDGRNMLIDCGQTINFALEFHKIREIDINDVYISHLHADHIGNLENFAFSRYDWVTKPTHWKESKLPVPRLIGNEGLLIDLWNKSLQGGLKDSMEGFQATLETFFEVVPIRSNETFVWQGWTIELIQQIHVMAGNVIMPTYGVFMTKEGHKTIYFTTDTQHCSPSQITVFYKKADVIFQDCELTGINTQFKEGEEVYQVSVLVNMVQKIPSVPSSPPVYAAWPTNETDPDGMKRIELQAQGIMPLKWERFKFGSGVHANYSQLTGYDSANSIKLSSDIKTKMWLSHYQDFKLSKKDMFGNDCDWDQLAKEEGFAGFVSLGQEFEF